MLLYLRILLPLYCTCESSYPYIVLANPLTPILYLRILLPLYCTCESSYPYIVLANPLTPILYLRILLPLYCTCESSYPYIVLANPLTPILYLRILLPLYCTCESSYPYIVLANPLTPILYFFYFFYFIFSYVLCSSDVVITVTPVIVCLGGSLSYMMSIVLFSSPLNVCNRKKLRDTHRYPPPTDIYIEKSAQNETRLKPGRIPKSSP